MILAICSVVACWSAMAAALFAIYRFLPKRKRRF
jgi:hypothetical protein